MKRFTYFEPLTEGHCAFWADTVISGALRDPRLSSVRFVGTRELTSRMASRFADSPLEVITLADDVKEKLTKGALVRRGLAQWAYANTLAASDADICFLPFFDHAVVGAIVDRRLSRGRVGGVIFRPPNHYGRRISTRMRLDAARRIVAYSLGVKRPMPPALMTLDELAADKYRELLTFVPDPAPDLSFNGFQKRSRLDGRSTLLLFGSLAARKGVIALFRSLDFVPRDALARLTIRMVGRVLEADRADIESALSSARSKHSTLVIEFEDRFLSDDELALEVVNADVVLAPYQNHVGSSGVLYWAAAAGRPVISQHVGLMGYQTNEYGLGLAVDATDPRTLGAALSSEPSFMEECAARFLQGHSRGAFANSVIERLL